MSWTQRSTSVVLWSMCVIITVICTSARAQSLASVESLPLDKFDEYLPADTLPHPWQTYGQFNENLSVLLQPWAESDITHVQEELQKVMKREAANQAEHMNRVLSAPVEAMFNRQSPKPKVTNR